MLCQLQPLHVSRAPGQPRAALPRSKGPLLHPHPLHHPPPSAHRDPFFWCSTWKTKFLNSTGCGFISMARYSQDRLAREAVSLGLGVELHPLSPRLVPHLGPRSLLEERWHRAVSCALQGPCVPVSDAIKRVPWFFHCPCPLRSSGGPAGRKLGDTVGEAEGAHRGWCSLSLAFLLRSLPYSLLLRVLVS